MKHGKSTVSAQEEVAFNLGRLHRTIEEHIEHHAAQEGCPYTVAEITAWLGRTLSNQDVRQVSGHSELVPKMWKMGLAVGLSKKLERGSSTDLHVRPHGRRTLSKKALKAISNAQKARWARYHKQKKIRVQGKKSKRTTAKGFNYGGTHWTQQPENKNRLRALAKARAAKLAA